MHISTRKLTYEEVKQFIEGEKGNGCKLLTSGNEYKNTLTILSIECECGSTFLTSFDKFKHRCKRQCNICGNKITSKAMTKTHREFINELFNLVGCEYSALSLYVQANQDIKFRHNKCGYVWDFSPKRFLRGERCPLCSNYITKKGVNDIATTHPDRVQYFVNIEDAYKYKHNSKQYAHLKCPECGTTKYALISNMNLIDNGFSCAKCGDGSSYPNKFMFGFLDQLGIDFNAEVTFKWSRRKIYDFYFIHDNVKYIIEVHGSQHYFGGFESLGGRSLKDEISNDKLKKQLAKDNGIDKYIVIDSMKAEMDYIKNSILHSELSKIFDISKIDWVECHRFGCSNKVKLACSFWNDGYKTVREISEKVKVAIPTARRYLEQGQLLGYCDYTPLESMRRAGQNNSRKVICIDTKYVYVSAKEAAKQFNGSPSNIRSCCRGVTKTAFGYQWMYYKDYVDLHKGDNNNII